MASETVSSDPPSAPEVVEKKECDEVKTMKELVCPPKENEEMAKEAEKKESEEVKTKEELDFPPEETEKIKDENPEVEEKPIEPPSIEVTDEEKLKIAEPEENVEEKLKAEDVSESVLPVEPEEKQKVEKSEENPKPEDLTAPSADPEVKVEVKSKTEEDSEEKVEDKSIEACNEKGEIRSDVPEQAESKSDEKREIESSKSDVIEENTEEVIKKTSDVSESSVDDVIKAEEEKKEALPGKETEVAAQKDAETSVLENTNEVIPEAVIAEEEKPDKLSDEAALGASLGDLLNPQTEEIDTKNVKSDVDKENNIEEKTTLDDVVKSNESTNDADAIKETKEDTPVGDVPVPKSKQSNNILRKMKQSLMKAKKAIIGKSANSKTPSPEMKAGIEA